MRMHIRRLTRLTNAFSKKWANLQEQGKSTLDDLIRLAEQGDATAQYSLGFMYGYGRGVAQDEAEAVKWYRLAAEQGRDWAQDKLGDAYRKGEGVLQDYAEAAKRYRLAARAGK